MKSKSIAYFVPRTPSLLVLVWLVSFDAPSVLAAAGDLDTSLARTGKLRLYMGGGDQTCLGLAVQADGKLVLTGQSYNGGTSGFQTVRIDTNNVLDRSFGPGGAVLTPFFDDPTTSAGASAVKIQSDGKILVGGGAEITRVGGSGGFALARYNPDGSLDTTFGTGGKVVTDFGLPAGISAMTVQNDGRIVVAGLISETAGPSFALARYETNGVLDSSFGTGGTVVTDVGGGVTDSGATSVMLQPDGRIVAAGNGQNSTAIAIVRYATNGVLDTTLGGTGKVFTSIPGLRDIVPVSVGYQLGNNTLANPDKIVVAASGGFPGDNFFGVARYNLDGSLDSSFGVGGIATNTFGPGLSVVGAEAILVQGAGAQPRKITVAGYGYGTNAWFAMARMNAAGSPDTTFGTNGTGAVMVAFDTSGEDAAYAMAIQSGQIVLAGQSGLALNSHTLFSAVRFSSGGILDSAFGSNGIVRADFATVPTQAQSVAMQPDGKIVVAGVSSNPPNVFAVARCNSDGSFDSTFGANGHVFTAVGHTNCAANAVLVQPDGKIVAAGYSGTGVSNDQDFALVRYNADGSLDSFFGSGGTVITPITGIYDTANAAALQSDGKIVVAGSTQTGIGVFNFGVARYLTNGALDPSFAGSGKVFTSFAGGQSVANATQIQADGKIVVAGYAQVGTGGGSTTNFAVVRYNPDGSLDQSFGPFGAFGKVSTDFGTGTVSQCYGLALQPDGKLILAGSVISGGTGCVALVRYTPSGLLDTSFGIGGKLIDRVGATNDLANAVAVLSDGKIVVGAQTQQSNAVKFATLRYTPNGSRDTAFGTAGQVIVNFEDGEDIEAAMVVDQIDRPVIAGSAGEFAAVARLASEPLLKFTSISPLGNNQFLLQGLGVPDGNHTLYSSPNLGAGTFNILAPVSADAGGFWQYVDTNAAGFNSQFYRLSAP